ncbi:hypothetical protein RJ639_029971 [Escallonia herrerae]|uniref:OST48 middle domain-containing protein n=1 Tax=Escallonia herrerae TaxID=1293975 RepID=A0AA88X9J3_9ASTE|nr:hypothetical protein RJ639_029971 [Escallonia herrerae]
MKKHSRCLSDISGISSIKAEYSFTYSWMLPSTSVVKGQDVLYTKGLVATFFELTDVGHKYKTYINNFIESDVILGNTKIEVLKVLSASSAAYSASPKVYIVQARNNARIMISGSLDLFSNRCPEGWKFEEVISVSLALNVRHHKVGETDEPAMYRINDDLEYAVDIYEWSGTRWESYVANDFQVQFYLMSPYMLKTLSIDKKGVYYTAFKVPDVYGVFQFRVEYQRLGYTSLSLSKQVSCWEADSVAV